jgi:hypothetical protein
MGGIPMRHSVFGLEERIAAFKKIGIEVLQSGKRPGSAWAYFDTESLAGYPIELIKRG